MKFFFDFWPGINLLHAAKSLFIIPKVEVGNPLKIYYWRSKKNEGKGAQIDLLFDRNDFVINLCEIKFSKSEFTIDNAYAEQLESKKDFFKKETKTKKALFLTFISTF